MKISLEFIVFLLLFIFSVFAAFFQIAISWEILAIVLLALTPVSIKEFKLDKHGLSLSTKDETEQGPIPENSAKTTRGPDQNKHDSEMASKVLRTLKIYQAKHQGITWGFKVNPLAPDFNFFMAGVAELLAKGLIILAPNGLVGLSADGKNEPDLPEGDYWKFD